MRQLPRQLLTAILLVCGTIATFRPASAGFDTQLQGTLVYWRSCLHAEMDRIMQDMAHSKPLDKGKGWAIARKMMEHCYPELGEAKKKYKAFISFDMYNGSDFFTDTIDIAAVDSRYNDIWTDTLLALKKTLEEPRK